MDIILFLIKDAVTVTLRVFVTALAQYLLKRLKNRTALTRNKDGSDNIEET